MTSARSAYVIVDENDEIWLETIASSRQKSWAAMAKVCQVPKLELVKCGFKYVAAEIQTSEDDDRNNYTWKIDSAAIQM